MKGITFWSIFAAVQVAGLLIAIPGSPDTSGIFWVISGILLLPGSAVGPFVLDRLGIAFGYASLPVSAVVVNGLCWYLVKVAVGRVKRKK
jgi:hypothetical protein